MTEPRNFTDAEFEVVKGPDRPATQAEVDAIVDELYPPTRAEVIIDHVAHYVGLAVGIAIFLAVVGGGTWLWHRFIYGY